MQFDRAFRYLVCFTVLSYIGCVGLIWACHNNGNWTYFKIQQQTIMGVSWWRIRSRSWIIMLSFGYSIHLHSRKVIGQTVPSNRNPLITHPCQRVEPPRGCKSKCFHVCDPLTSSAPNQYDKNIYIYIYISSICCWRVPSVLSRDDMTPAWVVLLVETLLANAAVATGNSSFDCSTRRLRPSISIGGSSPEIHVNCKRLKQFFAAA